MKLLIRLYQILLRLYNDFVRDTLIAISRIARKSDKALILDMDWYRVSLSEEGVRRHLYNNSALSRYMDFIRIERSQILEGKQPDFEITADNYEHLCFEGFNLWGICRATIVSDLGIVKIDLNDPRHLEKVREIYGKAALAIRNLKKLFARIRPDGVFVFQGGIFDSRCVIETAREFNINVIGIENSMIGGLVIIDNLSGQIINRHSFAHIGSEFLEAHNITDDERRGIFDLWKRKLTEKADQHRTGGIDAVDEMKKALDLPDKRKILLLLAQVRTDASVMLDSPLYVDTVDMIEDVVNCVRGFEDTFLVIRLHPKEIKGVSLGCTPYDRMTFRALKELGIDRLPNVRIVEAPEFNTYTLMDIADAGVTINSQAGLEMSILGKPVMVCGSAFYGRKGFTIDLGHSSALRSTLDFLIHEAALTLEQRKLALNFLYYFYKRHLFDHELSIHGDRLLQIFYDRPLYQQELPKKVQQRDEELI